VIVSAANSQSVAGESTDDARPAGAEGAEKESASKKRPKPFLAAYTSMARSMVYRGYAFPEAVLLLEFATFNIFTGVEIAREGKSKHWAVNLLDGVRGVTGALIGLAAFTVVAVVLRLLVRAAAKDAQNAADMVGGLIFFAGLAIFMFLLAVFAATFQARRRARQIDQMTNDELRAEAESKKWNVVLTRGQVKKVTVDPPPNNDLGKKFAAELRFETAAGKWKFLLPTKRDVKALVKGLRTVLGQDRVGVGAEVEIE
jgi:hypothetical protein